MASLTLQIVILGTPGILCYFLTSKLIGKIGKNSLEEFLSIFLFSILSYLIASTLIFVTNIFFENKITNDILTNIFSTNPSIKVEHILLATFVSILISILNSYIYNHNLFNKFARWIHASNRYGDEDVWQYLHTWYKREKDWTIVRDLKNDIMYLGYITAYSETEKDRELIIKDVSVYKNSTGEYILNSSDIYLSIEKNNITIEFNSHIKYQDSNEKYN